MHQNHHTHVYTTFFKFRKFSPVRRRHWRPAYFSKWWSIRILFFIFKFLGKKNQYIYLRDGTQLLIVYFQVSRKSLNIFTYNYSSYGEGTVSGKWLKFAFNSNFAINGFSLPKVVVIKESLKEQEREHDDVR